jgi:dTDP-4-dehydrorhamnose reductase
MRVVLLGAGGMLGRDLARTAPDDVVLLPFTRAELDITDYGALEITIARLRPHVVVNAAGYTAVDKAEAEPDIAFRVNSEAVSRLGAVAAVHGTRVVHFSTDYVFDGLAVAPYDEYAPTNPVNVYGASKLAGETGLLQSGARYLIVRTQWLFGAEGRSFPRTMWQRALERQPTKVVADQVGRATYAHDLAAATWRLIMLGASGLYHVANSGIATWFDIAQRVFLQLGRPDLLTPCTTAEHPTPALRPRYSALQTSRVEAVLGYSLPTWQDALVRCSQSWQPAPVWAGDRLVRLHE